MYKYIYIHVYIYIPKEYIYIYTHIYVFQIANDVRTFAIKPLKDNCTSLQALKYFSRVDGVIFKWVSLPWSLTHLKSFLPLGLLRPWLLL